MKKETVIFIIILFTVNISIAQINMNDIKEYDDLVEKIFNKNEKKKNIEEIEINESEKVKVEELFKKMYSNQHREFYNELRTKSEKLRNDVKKMKVEGKQLSKDEMRKMDFRQRYSLVNALMEKWHGKKKTAIMKQQYILRVKVLDEKSSKTLSTDKTVYLGSTTLICQIEEIIKGDWEFEKNEIVEIHYFPHSSDGINVDIRTNESYLLPIADWILHDDQKPTYSIVSFGKPYMQYFRIENEQILCPNDFFELGDAINWAHFVNSFKEKYLEI